MERFQRSVVELGGRLSTTQLLTVQLATYYCPTELALCLAEHLHDVTSPLLRGEVQRRVTVRRALVRLCTVVQERLGSLRAPPDGMWLRRNRRLLGLDKG